MIRAFLNRFRKDDDGAALVEFALLLPSLLLFLALTVEGGRTFWSYQTTVSGVRDAARYLSRVAPANICATGGSVAAWDAKLLQIVRDSHDGKSLFPSDVSIHSVSGALACPAGSYRGGSAGVATVTAQLDIDYPFAGLFTLVGMTLDPVRTSISDAARVLGT